MQGNLVAQTIEDKKNQAKINIARYFDEVEGNYK